MRASSRFTVLICSVVTAGLIVADSPPAHGQPRGAAIAVNIPYEQFVLPNGLRVLVHTDRKAPIVAVNIWYHVEFENVPTTALDVALWMESDRMGHLIGAIDQHLLDEQRGVVQNEKRQGENQPYGRAFTMILK